MSTIVGMFDDHRRAEQAINELDALGLEEGAIHVISRNSVQGDNNLLGVFARAVSGGDGAVSSELMRLGLDREEAEFYEEELDEDSLVIVVRADGDQGDQAMAVLQGANASFRD